jgi:hypothetical protein
MSRCLGEYTSTEFALGDRVSFDHEGDRLTGEVVRVYNARLAYHVEVESKRYEVAVPEDNPRKV